MVNIVLVGIIVLIIGGLLIKIANNNGPRTQEIAGYVTLTAQEAKKRIDTETDIILVDVRNPKEYAEGHLLNSVLIPFKELETQSPIKIPNKDATVFIYCTSGNRSKAASKKLVFLGYSQVFSIGGINEWPYEIVT